MSRCHGPAEGSELVGQDDVQVAPVLGAIQSVHSMALSCLKSSLYNRTLFGAC